MLGKPYRWNVSGNLSRVAERLLKRQWQYCCAIKLMPVVIIHQYVKIPGNRRRRKIQYADTLE